MQHIENIVVYYIKKNIIHNEAQNNNILHI